MVGDAVEEAGEVIGGEFSTQMGRRSAGKAAEIPRVGPVLRRGTDQRRLDELSADATEPIYRQHAAGVRSHGNVDVERWVAELADLRCRPGDGRKYEWAQRQFAAPVAWSLAFTLSHRRREPAVGKPLS